MTYHQMLKSYIAQSGLTLHDISKELTNFGFNISKGYISQLQNGKTDRPATDDLTRALAKVTGGNIEQLLTASFLERAPEEIKLKFIRLSTMISEDNIQETNKQFIELPVYESFSGKHRSKRILETQYIDISNVLDNEVFAVSVQGNTMTEDFINEGDIVICTATEEISYNDIALVSINNTNANIYRVLFQDNLCMLIPSNKKMQPLLVSSCEVIILGKVIELRKRY
ncbi:LexA family transcriptional regulator [Paenibacillus sp. 2TAB26]|uniref:LexA family transcriptional regulator n=1 Tax=Paenibacillus sp. 2TAB26 TaxID=3233005 RepID=UPI003F9D1345